MRERERDFEIEIANARKVNFEMGNEVQRLRTEIKQMEAMHKD